MRSSGRTARGYQLNVAQVMDRGPGAEQQILHRDEDVWVHLPRPHPEVQLASVIALVDFSAEIGATVVAPGSHRWERERQPEARGARLRRDAGGLGRRLPGLDDPRRRAELHGRLVGAAACT